MKIHVLTLGCPKNIVDSEQLMGHLKTDQVQFVDAASGSDVVIINTCAFLLSAREEAVDTILEAAALKKNNDVKKIFVTGCLPQKYGEELRAEIPEVDHFFDQIDFTEIATELSQQLKLHPHDENGRLAVEASHYAYLKIAEGCNNRCSYCTIPSIKGNYQSKDLSTLIAETDFLLNNDVKELIIVAQDITYYGKDKNNVALLKDLLHNLCRFDKLKWLRLMYAHPAHLTDELIEIIRDEKKICNYIDLPLQHISNTILNRMGRKVTTKDIYNLINELRRQIPDVAIRTSLIVGFPGETDDHFNELYEFVKEIEFERLGVFKYSREEGTLASCFGDQIDEETRDDRYQSIMELQQEIAARKNRRLIDRVVEVIVDDYDVMNNRFIARTQWDAPGIDNQVFIEEPVDIGLIYQAKIKEAMDYDLFASIAR